MRTCKTCGREIFWAITPKGRRIPLDARPVNPHLYHQQATGDGTDDVIWVLVGTTKEIDPVHVSHFLTCPDASEHSKKRRAG